MTVESTALQDQLDIMRLHHRYAWCLDHRDWSGLAGCFVDDAVVDYGTLGGDLVGAATVADFCRSVLEGLDASQHLIGNTMADVDGDEATATCYFQAQHVFVSDNGANTYLVAGTYTDQLRRVSDGWRIVRRTLTPMWRDGNAGVFAEAAARLAART
ncbi:nuclear transport factor 2 family protein [Desertimonas flava]|uniref:nuclear transport factor 2 family protein n=1 Tax=Desertimonas flava TaxID=2064846 RepID=UPI000E343432|nr:nuclear transport factor 2 family protein [Desertimonas flava]